MTLHHHHHHNFELLEAQHSIAIKIEPTNHLLALVHLPRRPQPAQRPPQARRRDAPFAVVALVHLERRLQIPLLRLLRLQHARQLLHLQEPVAVAVREGQEGRGLLLRQLHDHEASHEKGELGGGDLAVAVSVEGANGRVEGYGSHLNINGRALDITLHARRHLRTFIYSYRRS